MPRAKGIFLCATGWSALADSTSVEYRYSISWFVFVFAVTKTSVIQVTQSSGLVVVNG
jgi:hypothetical protein